MFLKKLNGGVYESDTFFDCGDRLGIRVQR